MPKIANKYAFDLFDTNTNYAEAIISGSGSFVTICDLTRTSNSDNQGELAKYRKIVQLLREVNKDLRDKGQNDLYIGYPFVIGRLFGENFDVRAPLALFPVKVDRTSTGIRIALDDSRDIVYNTTLILANFKFNSISKPLPTDTIEHYSGTSFVNELISFYERNDIHIQDGERKLRKFSEYKSEEFPHCHSGELRLESCAVLGKFPICSSSIQKDFDEILGRNEINALLNNLLINADEIDYYSDSYAGEEPVKLNERELEISEHNLVYINDLNSSQENVLSAIESLDALVVQGPPGTGKSQTITSLISEFVSNGKTVLMVSEKKTALDVVYSRLVNLSQYALLIDDVGNKDAFYQQLLNMVSLGRWTGCEAIDLEGISDGVDSLVSRLELIANKLYTPNSFGIEPYKMYLKNQHVDLSDSEQRARIRQINQNRDESLLTLTYNELENIHHIFSDITTSEKIARYVDIDNTYPWLQYVRGNISVMLYHKS